MIFGDAERRFFSWSRDRSLDPLTHRKEFRRLIFARRSAWPVERARSQSKRERLRRSGIGPIALRRGAQGKRNGANGTAGGSCRLRADGGAASARIRGEAGAPVAVGARLSQDESAAKLVFDLSRPVDASASALASPDRIVVDMPEVNFQLDPSVGRVGALPNVSLVKGFRFGLLAPGKSRIVIDLARTACPAQVSAKPIVEGEPAARLTIELKPCDPSAFAALVRSSAVSTASAPPAAAPAQPVIVLDPGHGGVDSGARGLGGVQEKTLVFDFCAELKRQLDATKRYAIVMTRDGDQYVDLDDRVAIARKANASLFISVHADTLSEDANVSGSTVYTVADRASDAEAARIAARENAAGRGPGGAVGRIIRTWPTFCSISSVERLGPTPTSSRAASSTTCAAPRSSTTTQNAPRASSS